MKTLTLQIVVLILFSLSLIGCSVFTQEEPTSIAETLPPSSEIENIRVLEDGPVVKTEISQTKEFNQCASGAPMRATISSSQINSEEMQRELVLKGGLDLEAGIPAVVTGKIQTAVEAHFARNISSTSGRYEEVSIEVPPNTKQEYTIIWEENRREGIVEYEVNGELLTSEYSYRLGIELISTNVRDVPCPSSYIITDTIIANPLPTYTPYPTYTPLPTQAIPTINPTATETQAPTLTPVPANTDLAVGQYYSQGNISFGLSEVEFNSGTNPSVWLFFMVRNIGSNPISFEYGGYNFTLTDNLGNTYKGTTTEFLRTETLDPGDFKNLSASTVPSWRYSGNYAHIDVTHLTLTVRNLSAIEHAEWVIPISH